MGEEKWNLQSAPCSYGFSRFGTADGCYRMVSDDCTWYGTWPDAETECTKYGSNVHLAGIVLFEGLLVHRSIYV